MSRSFYDLLSFLPEFFALHLLLSLTALAIGLSISFPLAVLSRRSRLLRGPVMGFASVVQTIPSLALLALMVPLLGMIGFVPALIALVLYSMLPVLRNTVAGLANVDRALIEAAQGVGMTPWQTLIKVELPVAAPTIIAGIRTSAVWVVGIATLATPVGQTTLGNFIFTGLQTQNQAAVILGCVAAAAMALLLDGIVRLIERGSEIRSRRLISLGSGALVVLLLAGLSPLVIQAGKFDDRPTLVVGAKTFTEQHVLAELLAQQVRSMGIRPSTRAGMGSQLLFDALAQGEVDVYVDYSGTIWRNVMKRDDLPSRRQMMVEMKRWLSQKYNITVAGRLGFENTYAFAMRRDRAKALGIKSISDLRSHALNLKIGGDVEFFGRPEWSAAKKSYDLAFKDIVSLDASIMYSACNEGTVDVIAAFSSDGRIAGYDLVVLNDNRNVFPPYDAVVLLSKKANDRSEVVQAVSSLVNMIDDDLMRQTNKLVDVDGQSPAEAAKFLLSSLSADNSVLEKIQSKTDVPLDDAKPVDPPPPDAPKLPRTSDRNEIGIKIT